MAVTHCHGVTAAGGGLCPREEKRVVNLSGRNDRGTVIWGPGWCVRVTGDPASAGGAQGPNHGGERE